MHITTSKVGKVDCVKKLEKSLKKVNYLKQCKFTFS